MSSEFSLSGILLAIEEVEQDLLRCESSQYCDIVTRLFTLKDVTPTALKAHLEDKSVSSKLYEATERIKAVATIFLDLEESSQRICSELKQRTRETLQDSRNPVDIMESAEPSEMLPAYHMRKHFLATLDSPYPTQKDKEEIVRITNEYCASRPASQNKRNYLQLHQLTLWFINARRRSGWSFIMQNYAQNDRKRMKSLVQAKMIEEKLPLRAASGPITDKNVDKLLKENLGKLDAETKQAFEDQWASMVTWIKYGVKEKVGDWVQDVVDVVKQKNKAKKSARRTVTTGANRPPQRRLAPRPTRTSINRAMKPSTDESWDSPNDNFSAVHNNIDSGYSTSSISPTDSNFGDRVFQNATSPTKDSKARQVKRLPSRAQRTTSELKVSAAEIQRSFSYPSVLQPGPEFDFERDPSMPIQAYAQEPIQTFTNIRPAPVFEDPTYNALAATTWC